MTFLPDLIFDEILDFFTKELLIIRLCNVELKLITPIFYTTVTCNNFISLRQFFNNSKLNLQGFIQHNTLDNRGLCYNFLLVKINKLNTTTNSLLKDSFCKLISINLNYNIIPLSNDIEVIKELLSSFQLKGLSV